MSTLSPEYVAAVVDASAQLYLHRNNQGAIIGHVKLPVKKLQPLDAYGARISGQIWIIEKKDNILRFLEWVLPYMQNTRKRLQAELLIKFAEASNKKEGKPIRNDAYVKWVGLASRGWVDD